MNIAYLKRLCKTASFTKRLPPELSMAILKISCACHWSRVLKRILKEAPDIIKEFEGHFEREEDEQKEK